MSSLRSTIAWLTALSVVVSLFIAAALIVTTSILHWTVSEAAAAAESMRLAKQAEIDLLLHDRAQDPLVAQDLGADLKRRLSEARGFVTSDEESRLLSRAETAVHAYLVDAPAAAEELALRHEEAYGALLAFGAVNRAQAQHAMRTAEMLDRLGNVIGIAASLLLLGSAGAFVVWLRMRAFAPVFEIVEQMKHFTSGERGVRAREDGVSEFRLLAQGFNRLTTTIERQREQQSTFLAGVAHDIRNPLFALKTSCAIISPERPLPPENFVRQAFARVQNQIDRLDRMVFDFLDAASIESGNLKLRREECDLVRILHAVVELFAPSAPLHRFAVEVPEDSIWIDCDRARLEQVLDNLVSNAIKFSPSGGTVRLVVSREDGKILLSVSDEGIGIPPDELDGIFDAFRRTSTTRDTVSGTGLGLFVARRIIEGHGGRISATGNLPRGSTISIELPTGRS